MKADLHVYTPLSTVLKRYNFETKKGKLKNYDYKVNKTFSMGNECVWKWKIFKLFRHEGEIEIGVTFEFEEFIYEALTIQGHFV